VTEGGLWTGTTERPTVLVVNETVPERNATLMFAFAIWTQSFYSLV